MEAVASMEMASGGTSPSRGVRNILSHGVCDGGGALSLSGVSSIGRGLGESRLRVALDVLQIKVKHGWTDTSVDDILEYVKDLLPVGNTCPGSLAEAKRITCPLDLPHEKYHACINDCIMYRKEHVDKTKCPVCEAERYKKGKKKAPRKVVWYFPLAPGFNGSTRTARKQSSCAGTLKEMRQC
ncbi:hypothetical protein QYE76_008775 [Lolium multiflorum]|uniref:Uncharacterized protein n=1 Tax=Lolium multiflorum TaxID=4521 RepID=A0AAD8TTS6_LOLMU|nr:hypothetical protein QYE76_008775 [Lolium multiflorum]